MYVYTFQYWLKVGGLSNSGTAGLEILDVITFSETDDGIAEAITLNVVAVCRS